MDALSVVLIAFGDQPSSAAKIQGYITEAKPQIIKCDIEGAEILFIGLPKMPFVEVLS